MNAKQVSAVAAMLIATLSLPVGAQTQRTGDNNARAMQQLQQLNNERTQLKLENDKLKLQVEQLQKAGAAAGSAQTVLQQKLKAAETSAAHDGAASQQSTEALEKSRSQLQELIGRFRDTAQNLRDVETDRNSLRGQLQAREREFAVCVDRSVGLFDLNTEILDRLERKGIWSSLTEKEPFTRIQRTRLENLIDGYRERAAELQSQNKAR